MSWRSLAALATLGVITACSHSATAVDTRGPLGGDGAGGGVINSRTSTNVPYTYGGLLLCTAGGDVVIDQVIAAGTEGPIRLQAVGLRSAEASRGGVPSGGPGALPTYMGDVKGFRVTQACDKGNLQRVSELAVQVARTGKGSATLKALRIRYHVGKNRYEKVYKFQALLCDQSDQPLAPDCREPAT